MWAQQPNSNKMEIGDILNLKRLHKRDVIHLVKAEIDDAIMLIKYKSRRFQAFIEARVETSEIL